MTRKQIDASREARLWITQVALPVAGIVVAALNIPEVREAASEKFGKVKDSIKNRRRKKYTNIKG